MSKVSTFISSVLSSPPLLPPLDEHQICQYTNCTINPATPAGERHCFNGFVVCSEHSYVQNNLFSANKSHHSCVSIHEPVLDSSGQVQRDRNGEIELRPSYRGCYFQSERGNCQSQTCTLSNNETNNGLYSCCCQGDLCNMNENRAEPVTTSPTTTPPTTGKFRDWQPVL